MKFCLVKYVNLIILNRNATVSFQKTLLQNFIVNKILILKEIAINIRESDDLF